MLLLSAPFEPSAATRPRLPLLVHAQVAVVAALLVTVGVTVALLRPSWAGMSRGLAVGAIHGGLIATGWLIATAAAPGWRAPVMRLSGAVILASVASHLGQWGPLAFLLVPVLLLRETWGVASMRAMGVCGARPTHLLTGLVAGAFLGMHLLLTASLTFGYRVHTSSTAAYVSAVAYDLGANVLSAEWLFRGALFTACWRLSSFWPAALATTTLALVRYLLDPALPPAAEARAGAIFYLG